MKKSNEAGFVIEGFVSAGYPIDFHVLREQDGAGMMDTIRVHQERDYAGDVEPLRITCASWHGNIAQTRGFALALLKACDIAEEREV